MIEYSISLVSAEIASGRFACELPIRAINATFTTTGYDAHEVIQATHTPGRGIELEVDP